MSSELRVKSHSLGFAEVQMKFRELRVMSSEFRVIHSALLAKNKEFKETLNQWKMEIGYE